MNFPITSSSDPGDIRQLQQALTDRGFAVAVDGVLGPKTTAAVKAFQSANVDQSGKRLTVNGIVGPATFASLMASAQPVSPAPSPGTGPFAGFDVSGYPGDDAMKTWKKLSPYSFVGYYLKSPCHSKSTWMGTRARIEGLGWGIAILYVGRQAEGPCKSATQTRGVGVADGQDALRKTASEGFAPGSVIYLDVEPMDRIPQFQIDYVNGWLSQFSGAGFSPGIYCHIKNANALKAASKDFPADRIAFWVSGSGHFVPGTSRPADSGIGFARVWQCTFEVKKMFGGVSIQIDEDVANTSTPSAPPPT